MLKGLDDVRWNHLLDAYGTAEKVPDRIRALVSGDIDVANKALDDLSFTIIHQGAIYPSGEAAVPFLGQALDLAPHQIVPRILSLLAYLSQGQGYYDRAQHLPILGGPILESLPDPDATIEEERDLARDTTRAVFAEWDRAVRLLEHEDAAIRAAALYLLVVLGQNDLGAAAGPDDPRPFLGVRPQGTARGSWAARAADAAETVLKRDIDAIERAGALSAFLPLGRADHPALSLDGTEDAPAIVRYVAVEAAVARAGGLGAPLADDMAPHIARLITDRDQLQSAMESRIWHWRVNVRRKMIEKAIGLSDAVLDRIADLLAPVLRPAEWQLYCMNQVLRLVLGAAIPRIPGDPCRLSPGRQRLVQAILTPPDTIQRPQEWFFHKENWTAQNRLEKLGLSGDAAVWQAWLNGT